MSDNKRKGGEIGEIFKHNSKYVWAILWDNVPKGERWKQRERLQLNRCYRQTRPLRSLSAFLENRTTHVWKRRLPMNILKHRSVYTFHDHMECWIHEEEFAGDRSLCLQTWLPFFYVFLKSLKLDR
jgi:hypothetical protein